MMAKRFLSLSLAAMAMGFCAQAQNTVLLADTAMFTHAGGGNRFSAWFEPGGVVWGAAGNRAASIFSADDFTIPAGPNWIIDSVMVFAYQTGSSPTTNPFVSGQAGIYSGIPGSGGTLIAGDTTTNRFAYGSFTGIYRTDTISNITTVTRPIYRIVMSGFSTILTPGTYWLMFGVSGTSTFTGPFINPKVLAGTGGGQPTNPANANARTYSAGAWAASLDGTTPLAYNMILKGRTTTAGVQDVTATAFKLNAPFPNPASGTANLSFTLGAKTHASLRIFNAAGQPVATVMEDEMTAGEYLVPFSTANLASGVYRVMLQTENGSTAVPLTVK